MKHSEQLRYKVKQLPFIQIKLAFPDLGLHCTNNLLCKIVYKILKKRFYCKKNKVSRYTVTLHYHKYCPVFNI